MYTTLATRQPRPELGAISVRINSPRNRFPLRSQISLPCTVNSYTKPNVYWNKNGGRLRDSRRMQVSLQVKFIERLFQYPNSSNYFLNVERHT